MSEIKCTLSNDELLKACHEWINKLCKSGGKEWVMHIPAQVNYDPDLLFGELCRRFKDTYKQLDEQKTYPNELNTIKNVLRIMPKTYRKKSMNWVIVQDILMSSTSFAGSTSSIRKCIELGIDPDSYTLE